MSKCYKKFNSHDDYLNYNLTVENTPNVTLCKDGIHYNAKKIKLPYDKKIEYLENNYIQYIETNIIPDENTGIYIKCSNLIEADKYIVGMRNDKQNTRWCIGYDRTYYYGYGNYRSYGDQNTLSEICNVYMNYLNSKKFIIQKNTDSVPNVVDDLPELSFTPLYPIRIFGASGLNEDFTKCKVRMYEVQITQRNQIILDLIPIRKNGVGYMFDIISKQLYGNNGTGEFILGPDIN